MHVSSIIFLLPIVLIFIGISTFIIIFMTIFGLVVITLVAFLIALSPSLLFRRVLFALSILQPFLFVNRRLIFRLFSAVSFTNCFTVFSDIFLFVFFRSFLCFLCIFFAVLLFIVFYSSKSGLIYIFFPDFLAINCKSLLMEFFNMIEILWVGN